LGKSHELSSVLDNKVRDVVAATFSLASADVSGDIQMGAIPGWDSMGHMQLILAIEDEFGVSFPNYAIADLVTVPAIVRAIEEAGYLRG